MGERSLSDRMKEYYEKVWDYKLPMRMPVILRLDGRAFHTLTKKLKLKKPFDDSFMDIMDGVAIHLCSEIAGAQFAYVQSDEISILIHNYKKLDTQAWFGNEIQKICSVSAGIASAWFTKYAEVVGSFDARVFVIPEAEVCNHFIWRQQDWERNSIQMLAQSLYSHKELQGKKNADLQELCFQKGQNWDKLPVKYKRGRCIEKVLNIWSVTGIPIFSKEREYIDKYLAIEEE